MLKASYHATERFRERGHSVAREAGFTPKLVDRAGLGQMLCNLVEKAIQGGRTESVFDKSVGCATLLVDVSGGTKVADVLDKAGVTSALFSSVTLDATTSMLEDLWAVVRGDTVITVLTGMMVKQNKAGGQFLQPNKEPFPIAVTLSPLMHRPLETAMSFVDNEEVYQWALAFFTKAPNASLNGAIKAANNAKPRVPPVKDVFARAKREANEALVKKELALEKAKEEREKAENEKLVEEMRRAREKKPLSKPVMTPLESNPFRGGFHEAVTPTKPIPLTVVAPPAAPEVHTMSTHVPTESEAIREAAAVLLKVMRNYGLRSCLLTVTDDDPKPRAVWEVERKRKDTGEADL